MFKLILFIWETCEWDSIGLFVLLLADWMPLFDGLNGVAPIGLGSGSVLSSLWDEIEGLVIGPLRSASKNLR